jgi:hypothetical protein
LIGLPPTPEEFDRYLSDVADDPYEALVDELLSRPQFGERWARPWLDLARYADSHGFQRDDLRDLWAYRDWVIQALNADMPFDQFTIEQLAGDLLPDATPAQRIATGFHRCAPTNVEAGSLPEETRVEQLIDRVNTTAAVWLGTTIECAQCHDHKYDPFTMQDYYRLLAYFNQTALEADLRDPKVPSSIAFLGPSMNLPNPVREQEHARVTREVAQLEQRWQARARSLRADLATWARDQQERLSTSAVETPLEITHFATEGTTDTYERLGDGSILLVGEDPPSTDVYTFRVKLPAQPTQDRPAAEHVVALKLEALTHPSLPGGGPGRGDAARPNFVLHDFTVEVVSPDHRKLSMTGAQASYSQKGWDVAGAIDDDAKTGWAIGPQFGKSQWALFEFTEPLDASSGIELEIRLDQHLGNGRTVGRFRLLAVSGSLANGSLPADLAAIVCQAEGEWTTEQIDRMLAYRTEQDERCQALQQKIVKAKSELRSESAEKTLVMVEQQHQRPSYVFLRGDYRQRGPLVEPGTPAALHPNTSLASASHSPQTRLDLARWLVDPRNPLVARVTVNRWWAELFGEGIVATVEDFGLKGEDPSHPELLDWLAVEFVESGWSMKHLLKTIVMSATYRQSSHTSAAMLEKDDRNRYLARGPRLRMDAEMIRDNALAISGLLSLKQGGPPIRPQQPAGLWTKVGGQRYDYEVSPGSEQDRRGVYVVWKRGSPYPSLINFDAGSRLACAVKRSRTNTPLQALNLLNDPVYVRAAQALSRRVLRDAPSANIRGRLEYAFRLCVARSPTEAEFAVLEQAFREHVTAFAVTDRLSAADVEECKSLGVLPTEFMAWHNISTTLLNLHETIYKD